MAELRNGLFSFSKICPPVLNEAARETESEKAPTCLSASCLAVPD